MSQKDMHKDLELELDLANFKREFRDLMTRGFIICHEPKSGARAACYGIQSDTDKWPNGVSNRPIVNTSNGFYDKPAKPKKKKSPEGSSASKAPPNGVPQDNPISDNLWGTYGYPINEDLRGTLEEPHKSGFNGTLDPSVNALNLPHNMGYPPTPLNSQQMESEAAPVLAHSSKIRAQKEIGKENNPLVPQHSDDVSPPAPDSSPSPESDCAIQPTTITTSKLTMAKNGQHEKPKETKTEMTNETNQSINESTGLTEAQEIEQETIFANRAFAHIAKIWYPISSPRATLKPKLQALAEVWLEDADMLVEVFKDECEKQQAYDKSVGRLSKTPERILDQVSFVMAEAGCIPRTKRGHVDAVDGETGELDEGSQSHASRSPNRQPRQRQQPPAEKPKARKPLNHLQREGDIEDDD
jgi:hypothetical protein